MIGNGHIKTFDGKAYDMKGKCSAYVLSKHCHVPNGGSSLYEIRVVNKDPIACSSVGSTCKKEFEVKVVGSDWIVLRKDPLVTVKGKAVMEDVDLKYIKITFLGVENVQLTSETAGITIEWGIDENMYIFVKSSRYKQTCGLCGTFDGDISNDFHTHDDDNEISEQSFALQWAVNDGTTECVKSKWDTVKSCEHHFNRRDQAIVDCKDLTGGVFETCRKSVSPDIYYENCLSDACASSKGHKPVIMAYQKACADKGVIIPWPQESAKRQVGE